MRGLTLLALLGLVACDGATPADTDAAADADASPDVAVPDAAPDATMPDAAMPDADVDASPDAAAAPQCGDCHGSAEDPAPPPGLGGETDPTASGVGAHAAHLGAVGFVRVRCEHCHPVPETIDAPGHQDDERPADVVFSGLAVASGASGARVDGTCATYCHGATLRIDPRVSPAWTADESLSCEGCHGFPPAEPHPAASDCARCHLDVVAADGTIADPNHHGDSVLQAPHGAHAVHLGGDGGPEFSCTRCHDGVNYHGPLRDGEMLETTGLCDDCHRGRLGADEWRGWTPLR